MRRERERMIKAEPVGALPLPREGDPSLWTPHLDQPSSSPPSPKPWRAREKMERRLSDAELRERVLGPKAPPPPKMVKVVAPPGTYDARGRPEFTPTDEQRRFVELAVTNGATHKEIAGMIANPGTGKPISRDTLKKVFKAELMLGHVKQRLQLSGSVFRQAIGTDAEYDDEGNLIRPPMAPNFAAAKWYEQSRFGLKEGTQIYFTDADGAPLAERPANINIGQVIFMMPKNGFEAKEMKNITPPQKQIEMAEDDAAE